jgi:hypothetical protein
MAVRKVSVKTNRFRRNRTGRVPLKKIDHSAPVLLAGIKSHKTTASAVVGTHETLIRKISGVPTGHVVHDHTSSRRWKHRAIFCDSSAIDTRPVDHLHPRMDGLDGWRLGWANPAIAINLPPEILSGFPKTPEPVVASSGDPTPQPSPRGVRSIPRDLCFPQAQL